MNCEQTEQTVGFLSAALSEALTVITQFYLHASILKAQGHPLAKRCYQEWVETMRRSDRLLGCILDLGGRPSSRRPTHLGLGREPRRVLELDIALAERWVALLKTTATACVTSGSGLAVSTLRELLEAERSSLDWRCRERDQLTDSGDVITSSHSIDGALAEVLDSLLRAELSAITQVYYHGQLFEAWGAEELGAFMAKETWEKTWRSLELTECLLATGANPTENGHGKLRIGRSIGEILDYDRDVVDAQLAALDIALERCDGAVHPEIHDMLSQMRVGELRHADWIAAQM